VTITGWAKGVDYRPGDNITTRPVNHSWNAVYIDGNWQLIDSHWATRFLQSDTDLNPDNLVYEYDDFYFVPDPEQLAYTHRPEDSAWQLLNQPQTAEQFEDYPLVKSYFFTNDMYFPANQNHGVVTSKKG
jgi:transglutaminase/protease-like cytokinesis protein 3